ncbi:MarR family winged helix-turn-helix transcriptional regulator [Convivina intestini]|uniref:DNA-binding MarR family transcriptional regulator n=1 Tax=Convivina intestini TaxID=1505726 RepID=A0A2U1D583_9LACO|nr:MarR family transcriptional regulator [Convivina intestini]PVY82838.1 DNA-binding MarR family transcriptional regulator [Convivina intestini]CAH1856851.1 hypothetical protein R077811_01354 [Convivina intestini]SDC19379.1 DNA-binding transcriptional regulator, MarR family [Leuconostocaceae bacterium R-53105]
MSNSQEIQELMHQVSYYYRHQLVKDMPITMPQAHVLRIVHQTPGIIQSDLARLLHRRNPTISNILVNLEKQELIERKVPADNVRAKEIYLTAKGEDLCNSMLKKFKSYDGILTKNLDDQDQLELIRILKKIVASD